MKGFKQKAVYVNTFIGDVDGNKYYKLNFLTEPLEELNLIGENVTLLELSPSKTFNVKDIDQLAYLEEVDIEIELSLFRGKFTPKLKEIIVSK